MMGGEPEFVATGRAPGDAPDGRRRRLLVLRVTAAERNPGAFRLGSNEPIVKPVGEIRLPRHPALTSGAHLAKDAEPRLGESDAENLRGDQRTVGEFVERTVV